MQRIMMCTFHFQDAKEYHTSWITTSELSFEIGQYKSSNFASLFKTVWLFRFLAFSYRLVNFYKTPAGIVIYITLNLLVNLGRTYILIMSLQSMKLVCSFISSDLFSFSQQGSKFSECRSCTLCIKFIHIIVFLHYCKCILKFHFPFVN